MQISMYQASVPVFIRMLTNLVAILEKATAHAEARKIDPSVLLNDRLFPDMFPLIRQVQIAADMAKAGPARLAGLQSPSFEDTEKTFPELIERVRRTVAFLEMLTPEQIDGAEERSVTWPTRGTTRTLPGLQYLLNHVVPNVYFHITTTYNILRHNGVELGKQDFLGPIPR
jgi:uncharacterized protein